MAEGFARAFANEGDTIASAGIEAHGLNPRAVAAMAEVDIDIRDQQSNTLDQFSLADFDVLVTVCGHADEHCPIVPAGVKKLHWPLPDPAKFEGSDEEILVGFRSVRDDIRDRVKILLESLL